MHKRAVSLCPKTADHTDDNRSIKTVNTINKYQSLIIFGAVVIGLLLGQFRPISEGADALIVPFLMIMLFGLFLNIPLQSLLRSFANRKFFAANLGINFLWTPLFAFLLGTLFLKNEPALAIGLMMLLVTPCTDWYLIFTGIAKGDVSLSASILPINLILQVLLLPLYLLLFFGKSGALDWSLLQESILLVLILPFTLAQIVRTVLFNSPTRERLAHTLLSFFDKAQLLFLSLAIVAMFASQGIYLIDNLKVALILLLPLSLFFIVNYCLGGIVGKALSFSYKERTSLTLTILARNSPISLAIAVTAFPAEPLIALTLVIAPLIELPVLSLVAQLLLRSRKKSSS